jgi:hypothetical protein
VRKPLRVDGRLHAYLPNRVMEAVALPDLRSPTAAIPVGPRRSTNIGLAAGGVFAPMGGRAGRSTGVSRDRVPADHERGCRQGTLST